MNNRRSIVDEYPSLVFFALSPALLVPILVLKVLDDLDPAWLRLLLASATCVPTAIAIFYALMAFDRWRMDDHRREDTTGTSLSGILFAQAAVFLYSPMVVASSEDGPPIMELSRFDSFVSWVAAGACLWLGFKAKKAKAQKLALAELAERYPTLAARFIARIDKKGWPEITPENVLIYQKWFEKALAEVLGSSSGAAKAPPESRDGRLAAIAMEARYHERVEVWPSVVVGLVLAYLQAPVSERERDRAEWAGAVATRVNATQLRDSVQARAMAVFPTAK